MSKILFWVVIAVVVYLAVVFARSRRSREERCPAVRRRRDPRAPVAMIECPQCGTHFPEDEAVLGDGVAYCSERCRKAARCSQKRPQQ